ncbi:MAG: TauD/TfdA family dioxygenase, partial [Gammaproteobacteria bacterium]|nr:TauD/TfdA family dioxygenase [Gammaproteobacteria bacterium]
SGGDTHFCNMYAAYERMPQALRERLVGMRIKHDATHTSVGDLRVGFDEVSDPREVPGAPHPIIRTHPESGKRALFLGRRYMAYVLGLSVEDSEALLDEIWHYAAHDDDCWTQQWKTGDVVLWDNRAVMHRRASFDASERRRMHRTQLIGDVPFE